MRFDGFAGNEQVKEQLSLAFEEHRLPHAIILEGAQGCGKRTLAAILARAAVCTGQGEKPCGACPGCVKAKADSHPDIYLAEGTGAARSFHVEVIRFIRSDAFIKPNEAPNKVYLLIGADTMSEQAQNALLKILEEPPAQVFFILTCVSAAALLSTVRSRAQLFTLDTVSENEAISVVKQKLPEATEQQIIDAAKTCGGNIGQMLAALSGGDLTAAIELASKIAKAVPAPNEALLLQLTAPCIKDKDLFRAVLGRLLLIFRDACAFRAGSETLLSGDKESAAELSGSLTRDRLLKLIEIAAQTQRNLEQNANSTLLVTAFCAKLRSAAGR